MYVCVYVCVFHFSVRLNIFFFSIHKTRYNMNNAFTFIAFRSPVKRIYPASF